MSNLAPILNQRLLDSQLQVVKAASNIASQHGVALYLVGGTVRDLLLEKNLSDVDLSAVGSSHEFVVALANAFDSQIVSESQFGTSKLRCGEIDIDLATARSESYIHPGALPKVSPGSIYEDLSRRDFTINSMAISLETESWGELMDPFDGQKDLHHGLIRTLHQNSFIDDATRMLRAIRYAQRLGFQLAPKTEQLIRRDLIYLDCIKGDRIRHEFQRIFLEPRASRILEMARAVDVLSAINPGLIISDRVLNKLHRISIEPETDRELFFLSILTYSTPSSELPNIISRINMSSQWTNVARDTGEIKRTLDHFNDVDILPSQIHDHLNGYHIESVRGCALSSDNELVSRHLELYMSVLHHTRTILDGDDLIRIGVPEGPMIGKILKDLLVNRLDGKLISKSDEENFVSLSLSKINN